MEVFILGNILQDFFLLRHVIFTYICLINKKNIMSEVKFYDGKNGRIILEADRNTIFKVPPAEELLRINELSDGYHTFDELYEFRKMYNAALFNEWVDSKNHYQVHKSWKHFDGEDCFGGGWFIVSAMLPTGLISNHYKAEDWDLFQVPEVEKAKFEFDGHTAADVLERLKSILK